MDGPNVIGVRPNLLKTIRSCAISRHDAYYYRSHQFCESTTTETNKQRFLMATVQVRYIVHDVDAALDFYCKHLGFREVMHPAPAFAMMTRGDLRLVLSAPNPPAGKGQPMPDGRKQEPGGWNRFAIEVSDLAATVETLRKAGIKFRNEIVTGVGGRQILVEDPSGNAVELFEPTSPEARLTPTNADQ